MTIFTGDFIQYHFDHIDFSHLKEEERCQFDFTDASLVAFLEKVEYEADEYGEYDGKLEDVEYIARNVSVTQHIRLYLIAKARMESITTAYPCHPDDKLPTMKNTSVESKTVGGFSRVSLSNYNEL